MSQIGDGLKSLLGVVALCSAGLAPHLINEKMQPDDANSTTVQEWFDSQAGKKRLTEEKSTLALSKKPWKELSQAERQIVLSQYKEYDRRKMQSTMLGG